jgi:predicted component of type VI protein secretion system
VDKKGACIGRDTEHQISVPEDSQLSSKHGRILFEKRNFYVEELGSTNKTWLRISGEGEPSIEYSIHIDDVIKIGSTVLQVVLNEEVSNKENITEEDACKICFASEPNALCYPCGHLFCYSCLKKCKQCPVCRQEITDKVKVYK